MSLIEKATDILSRVLNEHPTDSAVLSQKNLDIIRRELSSDWLASYSTDINDLIEIVRKYQNDKKIRFNESKLEIPFALLTFLSNPNDYVDFSNKGKINVEDPTNALLKAEVVKLALSYIKSDIDEYRAGRQHFASEKRRKGSILY